MYIPFKKKFYNAYRMQKSSSWCIMIDILLSQTIRTMDDAANIYFLLEYYVITMIVL